MNKNGFHFLATVTAVLICIFKAAAPQCIPPDSFLSFFANNCIEPSNPLLQLIFRRVYADWLGTMHLDAKVLSTCCDRIWYRQRWSCLPLPASLSLLASASVSSAAGRIAETAIKVLVFVSHGVYRVCMVLRNSLETAMCWSSNRRQQFFVDLSRAALMTFAIIGAVVPMLLLLLVCFRLTDDKDDIFELYDLPLGL
jgi:hypothetical protein